jgi:hypothetical protein
LSESPAQLAVRALREYLLATLPAKVATINSERKAVLRSARVEPFVMQDAVLKVGATRDGAPVSFALADGTHTASELATAINALDPDFAASADADGRLVLTAGLAPSTGSPSSLVVAADTTGANTALGWEPGGIHVTRAAIDTPTWRGIVDGDWTLVPDMDGGFWVCVGDRTVRPWPAAPNIRRDEYQVTMVLDIIRRFGANQTPHRDREAIGACVRAVDEVLRTTAGRQLGRAANGDVMLADVGQVRIASSSFDSKRGFLFDVAQMTLTVRIFQRAS